MWNAEKAGNGGTGHGRKFFDGVQPCGLKAAICHSPLHLLAGVTAELSRFQALATRLNPIKIAAVASSPISAFLCIPTLLSWI